MREETLYKRIEERSVIREQRSVIREKRRVIKEEKISVIIREKRGIPCEVDADSAPVTNP